MTAAAIYARFSSDRQSDASIDDQVRLCQARLGQEGIVQVQVYADYALSGATIHRPELERLLADADAGRFGIVIAESLDRLSRDMEHIAHISKRLAFRQIRLVTVADGDVNELHVGLKGTMAALYLKDLKAKTHRGLEGRVRAGKSAGGLSYGYRLGEETGSLVIDDDQAAVVRRIFEEYDRGQSPRTIAIGLNRDRIDGPRVGTAWGPSTIHGNWRRGTGIMNNELYIGRRVWNRHEWFKDPITGKRVCRPRPEQDWIVDDVPELRIIDDGLWRRVKARQQALRTAPEDGPRPNGRARRSPSVLSGLMRCGTCGSRFVKVSATQWQCAGARNRGSCPARRTVSEKSMLTRLVGGMRDHLECQDMFEEFCRSFVEAAEQWRDTRIRERRQWEKRLGVLKREGDRIVDLVIKEGQDLEPFRGRLRAMDVERRDLEQKIAAAPDIDVPIHPNLAQVYARKMEALAGSLQRADADALDAIRGLIDHLEMVQGPDGFEVRVYGDLGTIIEMARNERPDRGGRAYSQLVLVAGAGFQRQLLFTMTPKAA